MMQGGHSDDQPQEFRLDGTVVPGAGMNKAGTYAVVITQYGRVADGCSAQSLGPVLHSQNLGNDKKMGGMAGMGMSGFGLPGFGMGGMGHPGAMMGPYSSPYAGNFYGQRRAVDNGRCRGYIPFCCTIQRDSLSAMELFVQRN